MKHKVKKISNHNVFFILTIFIWLNTIKKFTKIFSFRKIENIHLPSSAGVAVGLDSVAGSSSSP